MIGYFESATRSTYNKDRVYQIYADIAEKLGRDDIGTHTLRKTFGYHYYKKTRDIATLMFILIIARKQLQKVHWYN